MVNLTFVYPIYNEIENLPRLLGETARIAQGIAPDYEVVLVDDGSTDGSGSYIDRLAAAFPNVLAIHHGRNRGLGAAIRTGLSHATKDLVLYMDSDFPVSSEDARAALQLFNSEVDVLIGYRLGRAEGPRREIMSWTYNRLIRWGFGLRVRDVNFAFKLLRRSFLERMRLRSEGSFIDAELLLEAQRLGARIREVGINYHSRTAGVSTAASTRVVGRILRESWRYRRCVKADALGPAHVIISADDFGLCNAINRGVVEAHDHGLVTSASILATGEGFEQAAELSRARADLDIGIHLALTQTKSASPPEDIPSLVDERGRFPGTWPAFVARYLRGGISKLEIEREFRAQIERIQQAGVSCSHIDSHQHLHMLPGILPLVARLASEYGFRAIRYPRQRLRRAFCPGRVGFRRRAEESALALACRMGKGIVKTHGLLAPDDFRGFSEAGSWDSDSLARAINQVEGGVTEICCHPGAENGIQEKFQWGYQWEQELAALTSSEVAAAVKESGIKLTNYRELTNK